MIWDNKNYDIADFLFRDKRIVDDISDFLVAIN